MFSNGFFHVDVYKNSNTPKSSMFWTILFYISQLFKYVKHISCLVKLHLEREHIDPGLDEY